MTAPILAELPPDLQEVQRRWIELSASRAQQEEIYANEFAEPFGRLFAALPLHGAPPDMPRPRALISVLGFSWQPVALMAAWCRPVRMLVLGTDESLKMKVKGAGVLTTIARVSGVAPDAIEARRVGDPGEADVYRAVRDFLQRSGQSARGVFVDPTGGKKSMSASAALAGFLAGSPLVYVDYGEYHGPNRIPVAGTEYPRLLTNPLEMMGDLALRDIFGAFDRCDYAEAERLASRLAERLYEPRQAECLAKLATAYGAWDRFDFHAARNGLADAREAIARFAGQGQWNWAFRIGERLVRNSSAIDALAHVDPKPRCIDDGVPLLVWYLAAARRLLDAEKPSLALLLTYAAVERYVDLCLWVDLGLDDEAPDYGRIDVTLDREAYERLGRTFFGKNYSPRPLEGPLMFGNGAQLLATLAPQRLAQEDLGPLRGLSEARNKCEYEHGLLPKIPERSRVEGFLKKACEIVARISGGDETFEERLDAYRFPVLNPGGDDD